MQTMVKCCCCGHLHYQQVHKARFNTVNTEIRIAKCAADVMSFNPAKCVLSIVGRL